MDIDRAFRLSYQWAYAAEGFLQTYQRERGFLEFFIKALEDPQTSYDVRELFSIYRDGSLSRGYDISSEDSDSNILIIGDFLSSLIYDIEDDGELYLVEISTATGNVYKVVVDDPREYPSIIEQDASTAGYVAPEVTGYSCITNYTSTGEAYNSLQGIIAHLINGKDLKELLTERSDKNE